MTAQSYHALACFTSRHPIMSSATQFFANTLNCPHMGSPTLPPQAKQKIVAAYKQFQKTVKTISHTHRQTVTTVSLKIDQKHIDDIKRKIGVSA